jgi:hypothetical protein
MPIWDGRLKRSTSQLNSGRSVVVQLKRRFLQHTREWAGSRLVVWWLDGTLEASQGPGSLGSASQAHPMSISLDHDWPKG